MYKNIFINSNGSNIYSTLGALDKLKEKCKNITIWNVTGNASLILFYKLLGYTPEQTFDILKKFELTNTLINGHSLFPENAETKKNYILNYLKNFFKDSILDENSTLKNVEKLTGITPCFILWNRKLKKVQNINSNDYGDYKLLDTVMASLTNIGIFEEYTISKNVYSSLENIEPCAVGYAYYTDIEDFLYIFNISEFIKEYNIETNLGPLKSVEDEFLLQKGELLQYTIKKVSKTLPNAENILNIYSIFSRGNSKEEEKASLFILGHLQGCGFLEGKNTKLVYKDYLESVYRQV